MTIVRNVVWRSIMSTAAGWCLGFLMELATRASFGDGWLPGLAGVIGGMAGWGLSWAWLASLANRPASVTEVAGYVSQLICDVGTLQLRMAIVERTALTGDVAESVIETRHLRERLGRLEDRLCALETRRAEQRDQS